MRFYICQEPGCTHKGTNQKSNIRKHLRQVHKVQDEYPEWFTQTYPDDRRKTEEVKEETKKRNLITKYANARKKRKLEALKKEFPFETIIDVVVRTETSSSIIQRRRWETEEVWLSFLQNEIAEVEAERQTTSTTNQPQPQDSDEESDV